AGQRSRQRPLCRGIPRWPVVAQLPRRGGRRFRGLSAGLLECGFRLLGTGTLLLECGLGFLGATLLLLERGFGSLRALALSIQLRLVSHLDRRRCELVLCAPELLVGFGNRGMRRLQLCLQ